MNLVRRLSHTLGNVSVRLVASFFRCGLAALITVLYPAISGGSGRWRKNLLAIVPLLLSTNVLAQQVIQVSQSAWLALIPPERALIQQKYVVDLVESNAFGIIIDNQGVNESTPGTNVGASLGGAVGNAAYIDNALKGGNYSAKNQLAAGIVGAMLGSTLDSRPNAQYHFRYAVKLGSGDIRYFDETKSDPFRHPMGVCVSVPYIALIGQQLCMQTAAILRATYLQMPTTPAIDVAPTASPISVEKPITEGSVPDAAAATPSKNLIETVRCKFGNNPPVLIGLNVCQTAKGELVP